MPEEYKEEIAMQYIFQVYRTGLPFAKAYTRRFLEEGRVYVKKSYLDNCKSPDILDFYKENKKYIRVVETDTRGAGGSIGKVNRAIRLVASDLKKEITSPEVLEHDLVRLVRQSAVLDNKIITALRKFNRKWTPGFIRGVTPEGLSTSIPKSSRKNNKGKKSYGFIREETHSNG